MPNIITKNPKVKNWLPDAKHPLPEFQNWLPKAENRFQEAQIAPQEALIFFVPINPTLTLRNILIIAFSIKLIGFSERRKTKILVNFNFFSVVNDFYLVLVFSQIFTQFLMFIIVIKKGFLFEIFFFDLKNIKVAWKNGGISGYFYFFCFNWA